jgi:hypothetical protein
MLEGNPDIDAILVFHRRRRNEGASGDGRRRRPWSDRCGRSGPSVGEPDGRGSWRSSRCFPGRGTVSVFPPTGKGS